MRSRSKVAAYFIDLLPKDELSPYTTEDRYGFVHPLHIAGLAEKVSVQFIIRDFVTAKLEAYENWLRDKMGKNRAGNFLGARAEFVVKEQYRNMKEVLDMHPESTAHAATAMQRAGITVKTTGIRGGTDGSKDWHLWVCPAPIFSLEKWPCMASMNT